METRVDSLWINPTAGLALCHAGKSVADLRFPVRTDSIVVPLEMTGDALYVQVGVNGRGRTVSCSIRAPAHCLLRRLADSLGLPFTATFPSEASALRQYRIRVIDSLTIGPLSWYLTRITVYDFDAMAAGVGSRWAAYSGTTFFARFRCGLTLTER